MLQNYKIIKLLGRGSYGDVYLVYDSKKYYAMKKINIKKFNNKEKNCLISEIIVQKYHSCDYIIKFHDVHYQENYVYIISEYAQEGTLNDYIKNISNKNSFITNNNICKWCTQIAEGLRYLHDNNIIHRDLKTENIFLDKDYNIKIGDLGIIKILDGSKFAKTSIGTPYYMSPELYEGSNYNCKTDIWSLGCILYELITLKKPFLGKNIVQLSNNIRYKPYNKNFIHAYKEQYVRILDQLLEKDYQKRATVNVIFNSNFIKSFYHPGNINIRLMNLTIISKLENIPNWNIIVKKIIHDQVPTQNKLEYSKKQFKTITYQKTIYNNSIFPIIQNTNYSKIITNKNNDNYKYNNQNLKSIKLPAISNSLEITPPSRDPPPLPNKILNETPIKLNIYKSNQDYGYDINRTINTKKNINQVNSYVKNSKIIKLECINQVNSKKKDYQFNQLNFIK